MKRFSLILSVFLLGIVLVSCGKTAKMTSSKSKLPVEQSKSAEQEDFYKGFVLLKPKSLIVGVEPPSDRVHNGNKGVFISGRAVELSPYYIGQHEVTYKLWIQVYDWNQSNGKGYSFQAGQKGSYGDTRNTGNDPVTEVSWLDCVVWCNAYTEMIQESTDQCVYRTNDSSKVVLKSASSPSEVYFDQSKKGYRLPTEAEWEFAARYQGNDSTNALLYGDIYLTHLDSLSGAKDKYSDKEKSHQVA